MNKPWNLGDLRSHIRASLNPDRRALELIDSIGRSDLIFQYHVVTARDALNGIIKYDDPHGVENWKLILGASDRQEEFLQAKVVSEANLIGCAYTARSMLETFAQLLNLIILGGSLSVADCTPVAVARKLPVGSLKRDLDMLLASKWASYAAAFTNTVKHRQLIEHQVSISSVDDVVGIKIGAFDYRGTQYQSYWASEFLQGLIDFKNDIVGLGRSLNSTLGL
jgi:hypothetical protein